MFESPVKQQQYAVNPTQSQQTHTQYSYPVLQQHNVTESTLDRPSKTERMSDDRVKVVVKGVKTGPEFKEHLKVTIKGSTTLNLSQICDQSASDEVIVDKLESKIRRLLSTVEEDWEHTEREQGKPQRYKIKMMVRPIDGGEPFEQEFETDNPSRFIRSQGQGFEKESRGQGERRENTGRDEDRSGSRYDRPMEQLLREQPSDRSEYSERQTLPNSRQLGAEEERKSMYHRK